MRFTFIKRGAMSKTNFEDTVFNGKLIRYSLQLAMLLKLLNAELISKDEFNKIKCRLMSDYNIISDLTT